MDYFSWLDPNSYLDARKPAPDAHQFARLLAYHRHVEARRKLAEAQSALENWDRTPPPPPPAA